MCVLAEERDEAMGRSSKFRVPIEERRVGPSPPAKLLLLGPGTVRGRTRLLGGVQRVCVPQVG